ncbi:MAG: hypothetical protein WBH03_05525 [Cyclobacteriaceae bacterium]
MAVKACLISWLEVAKEELQFVEWVFETPFSVKYALMVIYLFVKKPVAWYNLFIYI